MRILAVIAMLGLAACDSGATVATAPNASAPAVDESLVPAAVEVVAACPGLQEYEGDWKVVDIEPGPAGRATTVEVVIDEAPDLERIPAEFYAAGHHCFFEVGGKRADRISVAKRPCVSVCKGSAFDGPGSTDITIR